MTYFLSWTPCRAFRTPIQGRVKPPPPKTSPSVLSSENVGPVFKALIPENFQVSNNNENEYASQTICFDIITLALPSPFALKEFFLDVLSELLYRKYPEVTVKKASSPISCKFKERAGAMVCPTSRMN